MWLREGKTDEMQIKSVKCSQKLVKSMQLCLL